MLKIDNIYEIYIQFSLNKINKIKKHNEIYVNNLAVLQNRLKNYKQYLKQYCKVDFKDVLTYTLAKDIKKINFPNYPIYDNGKEINFKALRLYITKYIEYNGIVTKNNLLIKNYEKEIISKRLYLKIIEKFNKKIIDKIVYNNLNFTINANFGFIAIYKIINKRKRIDWGKSTKNKEKLLQEGKIPYLTADAEKDPNYKGVKWIEYRDPLDFVISWRQSRQVKKLNPMLIDYSFIPARGGNSFVSKLGAFKKNKEQALLTYTRE